MFCGGGGMVMQSGPPRMMMGAPGARHLNPRFNCFLQGAGLCVCLFASFNCRPPTEWRMLCLQCSLVCPQGVPLPGLSLPPTPTLCRVLVPFPPSRPRLVHLEPHCTGTPPPPTRHVPTCSSWTSLHRNYHPPPPQHVKIYSLCSRYCRKGGRLAFDWNAFFYHKWRKRTHGLGATLRGPGFDRWWVLNVFVALMKESRELHKWLFYA